jgi:tetratricopeptide (TPR) repeat protein
MIVKNEEKYIRQCLASVWDLIDEAIVVDTGSTDNTVSILQDFGANVEIRHYPWRNDFAAARNESLRGANGDWILILDADEKMVFQRKSLLEYLADTNCDALCIPTYNMIDAATIQVASGCLRLMRNKGFHYTGAIHEQLTGTENIGILDEAVAKIIHYGYAQEAVQGKDKRNRNKAIIEAAVGKNPDDPLMWYHLGMEHMSEGDFSKALHLFYASSDRIDAALPFRQRISHQIATCMYNLMQYEECVNYIENLLNDKTYANATFYFILGCCFQELNRAEAALTSFRQCLRSGKSNSYSATYGLDSFYPKLSMARIFAGQKDVYKAAMQYMEGVFDQENVNRIGSDEARKYLAEQGLNEILVEFDHMLK